MIVQMYEIDLEFDPMLVTFCQGFSETQHPYVFIARNGFFEMLASDGALSKVEGVLPMLIPCFRKSLLSKQDDEILTTMKAIRYKILLSM